MENRKIIYAAILGAGTVGSGVYKLALSMQEELEQATGARLVIKKILVRNLARKREGIDPGILTDCWEEILADDAIEIVIELMGGIRPARDYIIQALEKGKQIVTANKDLLAECGAEVMAAAQRSGNDLQFEASVAGAIPIIRPLRQNMAGNRVQEIMGIVNGTTNFILSSMTQKGMDYSEALAKATELGFAEADPTADVEGYDAGRKIAIMASIAFHSRVTFDDVYTEGITRIIKEDISYAREFGYVIKLVGVAKNTDTGVEVKVHPMLIPLDHPLSNVNGSFNAVFVRCDAMGDLTFMGRGAGEMPTAGAVMGDVVDVMRNLMHGSCGKIGCGCYKTLPIKSIAETDSKFFLRIKAVDKPGVLANIASVLGSNDVSIAQVVQKHTDHGVADLVIITDTVHEKNFNDALTVFRGLSAVQEVSGVIRVY